MSLKSKYVVLQDAAVHDHFETRRTGMGGDFESHAGAALARGRCILSGEYASILLLTGGFCAAAPFALMGIRGGHDFTFHIDRRGSRTKSERWPGR